MDGSTWFSIRAASRLPHADKRNRLMLAARIKGASIADIASAARLSTSHARRIVTVA